MKRISALMVLASVCAALPAKGSDSIPGAFSGKLEWRLGVEANAGFVPRTNPFLKGDNEFGKKVSGSVAGSLRADFSFNPESRWGKLYNGVYQGIGVDIRSFMVNELLGTPASVYVYQGAPFLRFNSRLSLGYEWKFGAAFGWHHFKEEYFDDNTAVSTSVTAHMGLGLKLHYMLSPEWRLSAGVEAAHFSNGNTSWPNGGVNTVTASIGIARVFNAAKSRAEASPSLEKEADRPVWFYDVALFGAWRKRAVNVEYIPQLCPGKFAVAGLQFAPMRRFNRWFAAGAALDMQCDESAGIEPYWVNGTSGDFIKFYRPPFGKQINIGLSAHTELIMPVFAVNVGLGYDLLNPHGNKRFYQSLTLKTFVTDHLFINTGYRLSRFKDPQNLMLGLGWRF